MIDVIRQLDETSTRLIKTTNSQTWQILWLTGIGVIIAVVGVLLAAATYIKS